MRGLFQPGNAAVAAAIVVPLMLFSLAAWQSYDVSIQAAEQRAERTARILEEHALKVFETHRLIIDAVDERLRNIDWEAKDEQFHLHRALADLQHELKQVATITITGADGCMRASGRMFPADPKVCYADRDWFAALKSGTTDLPFISRSYLGRQSGQPIFNVVGRAPNLADGTSSGAVVISVDRSYFEQFYKAVEPTFDHTVLLVRSDGEILASEPATVLQKLDPGAWLYELMRTSRAGSYRHTSTLGGAEQYFSYRKVGDYPVYVRFGISRQAALAPWRDTLLTYGAIAGSTALCLVLAAGMALRQTRRERLAKSRWQDTAVALRAEAAERMRVESQMRQMQKMEAVGQLTGGIAHDFNNMLGVIISGLDLAKRRLARGDTNLDELIDMASDGARRAADLTRRLLAFSRQQPLSPEPLLVNVLVENLADILRRTLGETVRLSTDLAPDLWVVAVDRSQLENAILNLAVNARDAMPDGGDLRIMTANATIEEGRDPSGASFGADAKPGAYAMIVVTDTGTGMTPEVMARAFDPFFTTKGVGKGTGLGLSQIYGFVTQSQGFTNIESEPGRGTTFRLYLPRHEKGSVDGAATAPSPPNAGHASGGRGETILVVEDEDRLRSISVNALRDLGYTVLHAPGGDEALAILRDHPDISLLFTDVVMPGMTGPELAATVKSRNPGIKILFTTGYAGEAHVGKRLAEPGVGLIAKPFSIDDLGRRIRRALDD